MIAPESYMYMCVWINTSQTCALAYAVLSPCVPMTHTQCCSAVLLVVYVVGAALHNRDPDGEHTAVWCCLCMFGT
jgi:hypothetical protein